MSLKKSRTRNAIVAVAGTAAIGLAVFGVGSTGADFSASDSGTFSTQSGTLTVELSDATNTGTFDLAYPNLAPGETKLDTFVVKNTGSIPADVKISNVGGANNLSDLTSVQRSMLKASIDGYLAATPITSLPGSTALGSLNPGQSRTYKVRIGLDQAAGNDWQGRNTSATVTVTLAQ